MGTIVLARGFSRDYLTIASFLLDSCCLGIKDVMFDPIGGEEFENYMEAMSAVEPMIEIDPAAARKLLRDLAAWSQSIGFAPHRDFAAVERIFGDVNADASDAVYQFGQDGKPVYIPGPNDSPHLSRQRVEHLRKRLGDDGFESAA